MPETTERNFYDVVADDYDSMTAFEQRLPAAIEFVGKLRSRLELAKAVDVACGTGLYAIALARENLAVRGIDISEGMIRAARLNADRYGVSDLLKWQTASMQDLRQDDDTDYDAVICMANSLPHLLTHDDLIRALRNFYAMLRDGGMAVIHLLNYRKIINHRERIISIDRHNAKGKEFIRFYDFLEDGNLRFNILRIDWRQPQLGAPPGHELQSVLLRPYLPSELRQALMANGFGDVKLFGSPQFTPFDPDNSATVMLTACKQA